MKTFLIMDTIQIKNMKRISILLINSITLIFALVLNSLQGSEVFNGTTVGEVSAKYETLFTPQVMLLLFGELFIYCSFCLSPISGLPGSNEKKTGN
jgi:hypothetical protein